MKAKPLILLLIAAAFVSLTACKKNVDNPGTGGGRSIDPQLLGMWGWYSTYSRVFDEAGNEYQTPPPFNYGSDDAQNDYKGDGTYYVTTDTDWKILGWWYIKDGKLVQDDTEYEYYFEDNNRTLILKKVIYFDDNGTRYRRDEYSVLSRDWLP